jgi:glycosyltransferase involved in cell wall biosynthesis
MQPKVTIVIPVYNGGDYFELALQSALAQTYQNVEIVVVNDGSTDGGKTDAVAKKYLPKIKYIHQQNKGVGGALNAALQAMSGDFFAWLSHDDLFVPEKIAAQIDYHRRLGKPDAVLFSDYDVIDSKGDLIRRVRFDHAQFVQMPMLPLMHGCINGCTIFVPAHIMREFAPFDESLPHTQDYDFWNRVLSRYELFHQPASLVRYRVHPQQGSQRPTAAKENSSLWIRMMNDRSVTERVHLFGSTKRFFLTMADLLDHTRYQTAAQYARDRARSAVEETLVSVVIPFNDGVEEVLGTAQSVLGQTHRRTELILLNGGSTVDLGAVDNLVRSDRRVRLISAGNVGLSALRNRGMDAAVGEYLVFLNPGDLLAPHKIQYQLLAMQDTGSVASHTSHYVTFPERFARIGKLNTGAFSGRVYPEIIQDGQIATSTAMIHRSIASRGLRFTTDDRPADDLLAWIWIAQRHEVLGIDEPLSVVKWSTDSAAINLDKSIDGIGDLIKRLRTDPIHSKAHAQISALSHTRARLIKAREEQVKPSMAEKNTIFLDEELIAKAFGSGRLEPVKRIRTKVRKAHERDRRRA